MFYSYDHRTAAAVPTDYAEAKARQAELEAEAKRTTQALKAVAGDHPMGLTPDAIKATPEWKTAKRESDAAFRALQNYNTTYVSRFKSEIQQDRRNRGR
jgi:hypothetical protein